MIPQTANPIQNHFHVLTNIFDVNVILSNDKLTITLKDFTDWTIYEKEYTKDDYCKEISHKMDLFDVYNAFSQTQTQCDQEYIKENKIKLQD